MEIDIDGLFEGGKSFMNKILIFANCIDCFLSNAIL